MMHNRMKRRTMQIGRRFVLAVRALEPGVKSDCEVVASLLQPSNHGTNQMAHWMLLERMLMAA